MSQLKHWFVLTTLLLLTACNSLTSTYERPQVNITSFTLAPDSTGALPRFNIGIQIINPNRTALSLRGMSYGVEIEGNRILSGATPNLPTVPAYDSADFVIEASPDLLGGVRLLTDLFSRQRTTLGFTFRARIDLGGLRPSLNITESGSFGLPDN